MLLHNVAIIMLLVETLKYMFVIKNLRVYNIGELCAAFSLRGPLCATFPYVPTGGGCFMFMAFSTLYEITISVVCSVVSLL